IGVARWREERGLSPTVRGARRYAAKRKPGALPHGRARAPNFGSVVSGHYRQKRSRGDRFMIRVLVIIFILIASSAFAVAQTPSPSWSPADPCAEMTTRATRAENRLKDWPQLARYRDANAKVPAPVKDETRVVFVGDSITDSWQNPKFGGFFPGKPY